MTEHRFIALAALKRSLAVFYAICIDAGRNALLGSSVGRNDSAAAARALEARGALE